MDSTKACKKEIAYFMRRLYKRGLTTTTGGNISVLLPNKVLLITASQTDKARMKAHEVALVDMHGRQLSTSLKPSMETAMHIAIYKKRPDVRCIIHAHPPLATAFAAAHQTINTALTGEGRALLGQPALAPYALMGSSELARNVADLAAYTHVVLMANHGVITLGKSLMEAFERMEVLENNARTDLLCRQLGGHKALAPDQLQAIDLLMKQNNEDS